MKTALLFVLLLDASREPAFRAERLGAGYRYLSTEDDRGLEVEAWRNESLGRRELWHKPGGEYFPRVDDFTYVGGFHDGGVWRTDPSVRLVWRGGGWRRLDRQPVRAP